MQCSAVHFGMDRLPSCFFVGRLCRRALMVNMRVSSLPLRGWSETESDVQRVDETVFILINIEALAVLTDSSCCINAGSPRLPVARRRPARRSRAH